MPSVDGLPFISELKKQPEGFAFGALAKLVPGNGGIASFDTP